MEGATAGAERHAGRRRRAAGTAAMVLAIVVGVVAFLVTWPYWALNLLVAALGGQLEEARYCDCPELERQVETIDWSGSGVPVDMFQRSAAGWLHLNGRLEEGTIEQAE